MACSNPFRINSKNVKQSIKLSHAAPLEVQALERSNFHNDYFSVPCGWCLNCRVDKMNELTDRCEYEYIKYGCGAFVTFTFDDYHLNPYQFVNAKDGKVYATLSKKCAKDFLNRLNKEVHKYNKKYGLTPYCRPDYKYLLVGEYGEHGKTFDRPHFHALFFGLDFAMCERLFWRAWQFQGSIQVGAIRNGGIGYVISYLDKQLHGYQSFLKYDYNNLQKPFRFQSLGLGEELYSGQLKYIKNHDGCYRWHGKDKPVPIYYKNKFNIISDISAEALARKFNKNVKRIKNLYDVKIHTFKDLEKFNLDKAQIRKKTLEIKLVQNGKQVYNESLIQKQSNDIINDRHRIPTLFDKQFLKVVDVTGKPFYKIDNRNLQIKDFKTRDFMKLHTSKNQLYDEVYRNYGAKVANNAFCIGDIPF